MNIMRYLGILTVFLLLGCAQLPKKPLVEGETSIEPMLPVIGNSTGSIYQSSQPTSFGYQPMFEDRRPRNIGDVLTIVLQENVSASKSSSINAGRNGSTDLSVKAVPQFLDGLIGRGKVDTDISGANDFKGSGGANAKNTFSGTITVTVQDVMVNGNLKVIGEKQIAINQGTEFIRFSGVVNPRTISGNNTVISTQVADARIEYVGNGYIDEAQTMGWLQRLFFNFSPF
ncbi:flagellar basal body L-ring protein FlgH [Gilliamella sp. B3791]|uniref:flagellar basal body L-ring protein FlgH n=1 Tax=unclassified Gilliamella TaxID=2685620 RepID=UPI0008131A76|nr:MULTISPECIES: flagellar basal body L-ring protein FlgH [Gilliamella]MCX8642640.1 flagellar basal body L-ring protein FlgH [Gilliamella sp. B3835]MCX8708130.1 flagellar basal body L-ring protein FlgH [Gilliamella sp. B3783]MCX8709682.1 flagellar basal body L-ring protein FlgH [Gilliamella sp. B3780]MCX8712981.1 flagellar basal body L-ring protein FlgH [Gilliamella sp. B3468]MCX8717325.1 flagellar basal body L-ring protein FlgH [Gilliamella sp. B3784]